MEKETRHQKAEKFRKEIALVSNRNQFITSLLSKDEFDATDKLRVTILFQKASYLAGCEQSFIALIHKIRRMNDTELSKKVASFAKKLNIKMDFKVDIVVC